MGENTQNKKIAIIIMASGYSERFGSNKLLESFLDKPLFTYTARFGGFLSGRNENYRNQI